MPNVDPTDASDVVFAAHLPLLRIAEDSIAFAGGDLWRMPFETFNVLTVGAFEDHADKYIATAPVFYRLVVRPDLPNLKRLPMGQTDSAHLHLKLPGERWPMLPALGLGFIQRFHEIGADPAWLALLLEAPATLLPQPRWSVTFAIADEGWGFESGDRCSRIASVQGDADMDYLMTPAFACAPLPAELIGRASARAERLGAHGVHPALAPALATLAHCSSPLLLPDDQATLATIALEALLLPEVRSGMGRTLAHRLGALLAGDAAQRAALQQAARTLYNTRSASLHGAEWPAGAEAATLALLGPRLLADAIVELDARCGTLPGEFAPLLDALDGPPEGSAALAVDGGTDPAAPPQSPRPRQPLQDVRVSTVAMVATNLESPAGHYLMWAPLVGLRGTEPFAFADKPAPVVMALSGHEAMLLEERDIARDFAARARLVEEHVATLAIFLPEDDAADETAALRALERQRDLAVAALRMAGFDTFHDPALAGSVMVRGPMRWRQPSVLRQSMWQMLLNDAEQAPLVAADAVRVGPHWRLLREYQASPGHADIERALSLYRRSFDLRFAATQALATMRLGLLEALLGRFRARGDGTPLEQLVTRLLGPHDAAALWFAEDGRALRNDLAHGRADAQSSAGALGALGRIVGAALPRAIRAWLDAGRLDLRPGHLLIDELSAVGGPPALAQSSDAG